MELPKQVFRQQTVLNQFQAMGPQLKIQDGNIFQLPAGNIWVNYNELTTSSLEIIVSKGDHPQMALIQVSELL